MVESPRNVSDDNSASASSRRAELEIERLKLEVRRFEIESETRRFEAEMQTRLRERQLDAETRRFEATQETRRVELQLQMARLSKKRGVGDDADASESSSADDSAAQPNEDNDNSNSAAVAVPYPVGRKMKIYFGTLMGRSFSLDVDPNDTVEHLKDMIQETLGIPTDQQRLVFAGIQLDDVRTLRHYGVFENCRIMMILRLRGC
jgi:large subunit ribosomal protein L40e